MCDGLVCGNEICGGRGAVGGCAKYIANTIDVDSSNLPAFNLGDLGKNSNITFVRDLMKALNMTSTQALEKEVKNMIKARQTLQMRGLVK